MKVTVTQSDIDYGVKNSAANCPIANAIKNQFKNTYVYVDGCEMYVGGRTPYYIPRSVKRFINAFDQGKKVTPFTFILKEI